ncbi:MAG: VapC toxin family PIN domain ribonuclease [Methylophilaceae bacterium]|nr:VapC toxin family PIN domain ribonuclease [Methylophilaceae bacterium]
MRALLDVNVLIALLDAGHACHDLAMRWLSENIHSGWASCPITQNGCIRIMSQPRYPGALPSAQVAARLAEAATSPEHEFWPDTVSLLDMQAFDWTRVLGPRQVTDLYLLTLAVKNNGRFVTFDRRITVDAVQGATPEQLLILQP